MKKNKLSNNSFKDLKVIQEYEKAIEKETMVYKKLDRYLQKQSSKKLRLG